jgi:hypothetical protein
MKDEIIDLEKSPFQMGDNPGLRDDRRGKGISSGIISYELTLGGGCVNSPMKLHRAANLCNFKHTIQQTKIFYEKKRKFNYGKKKT